MNSEELDTYLCKKYPKMFRDRRASMRVTAMCWGFECGPGWGNILKVLCGNIQHHVDWKRKQRASALQFNRVLKRALNGDKAGLIWYNSFGDDKYTEPTQWTLDRVAEEIERAEYRAVPEAVSQVVVSQVKEKFGSLRFYYSGGDEAIDGMVRIAEGMSGCTCEECGAVGKGRSGGWIRTLCDEHAGNPVLDDTDEYDDEETET